MKTSFIHMDFMFEWGRSMELPYIEVTGLGCVKC